MTGLSSVAVGVVMFALPKALYCADQTTIPLRSVAWMGVPRWSWW
jgi:hypothetical protein